jgi:hypothetical protein
MANIDSQAKTYLTDLENQKNTLGKKKYGNAYNPTLDWTKQTGAIMPSWTQMDEEYAKLQLQNYDAQKNYANALQAQAQGLYNTANTSKAQLGVGNEIVQKYLGNNLRASGQNTSGLAETTQAQMGNNYLNNLAQINNTTRQNEIDLLSAYNSARQAKENEYNTGVNDLRQYYDDTLGNEMLTKINELNQQGSLNVNSYNDLRNMYAQSGVTPETLNRFDKTYLGQLNEQQALKQVGITSDMQSYDINTIDPIKFASNHVGSGKQDSDQTKYVDKVINDIRTNASKYNGKVINMNYGAGTWDN